MACLPLVFNHIADIYDDLQSDGKWVYVSLIFQAF